MNFENQTDSEASSFTQLLRAQWTLFRTVRSWGFGIAIAALFIVLPRVLLATLQNNSCEGPNGNACPVAPLSPGGLAVEDRFNFVHQPLTGDGSLTVRLTAMSGIITYPPPNHDQIVSGLVPWAKAGIMVKESIVQGSAYAAVMLTASHGVRMQYNFTQDQA
jgi:hypothetical protein